MENEFNTYGTMIDCLSSEELYKITNYGKQLEEIRRGDLL